MTERGAGGLAGKVIALDYDGTFSLDPDAWYAALEVLRAAGASVVGVTGRSKANAPTCERWLEVCETVVCCGGLPKRQMLKLAGIQAAIWIDDSPQFIAGFKPVRGLKRTRVRVARQRHE